MRLARRSPRRISGAAGAVGAPMARQYGVQTSWGAAVTPREGAAMAVLSTSSARLPTQADYVKPLQFVDSTPNANAPPAGWPKNTVGCPAPMVATANDSVVLQLQIRVPTNARSFSYDLDFYTAEYLDYVCSGFNDTYVALLKSGAPLDPARSGNVSFDASGEPINVNSSFLQVCTPGTQNGKSFACPLGTSELAGTGFSGDGVQDGATSWLRTTASVLPGETITLSFMIWNTGDHWVGSTIVLDDFRWSATSVAAPTTGRPPL